MTELTIFTIALITLSCILYDRMTHYKTLYCKEKQNHEITKEVVETLSKENHVLFMRQFVSPRDFYSKVLDDAVLSAETIEYE